jgi:hypothetical protein
MTFNVTTAAAMVRQRVAAEKEHTRDTIDPTWGDAETTAATAADDAASPSVIAMAQELRHRLCRQQSRPPTFYANARLIGTWPVSKHEASPYVQHQQPTPTPEPQPQPHTVFQLAEALATAAPRPLRPSAVPQPLTNPAHSHAFGKDNSRGVAVPPAAGLRTRAFASQSMRQPSAAKPVDRQSRPSATAQALVDFSSLRPGAPRLARRSLPDTAIIQSIASDMRKAQLPFPVSNKMPAPPKPPRRGLPALGAIQE